MPEVNLQTEIGNARIHPFPARMAPSIAFRALSTASGKCLTVLDPMSGSGTTLVVARKLGHRAIGRDTDPLATLIARAWCSDVTPADLFRVARRVLRRAVQDQNKAPRQSSFPRSVDAETREFLRYWFDVASRRELVCLARAISGVRRTGVRELLWCTLSRMIIVKDAGVSLARDVAHSRPHRSFLKAPYKPFTRFEHSVRRVAAACQSFPRYSCAPDIAYGDARKLDINSETVDVIITSPPYLNAIDYLRGHKFSLVWMKHSVVTLRQVRATNVGTEIAAPKASCRNVEILLDRVGNVGRLPSRQAGMLRRFALDMNLVVSEYARVLKRKGRAFVVVGDSTLRGVFIRNSRILAELGKQHGLAVVSRRTRAIPNNRRYLPPPIKSGAKKMLDRRMRKEVVLEFCRT
jgi:hypothetical protein